MCELRLSDIEDIKSKTSAEVFDLLSDSELVTEKVLKALKHERVDGISLICLNFSDIDSLEKKYDWLLGEKKRFMIFLGLGLESHNSSYCANISLSQQIDQVRTNFQNDRSNFNIAASVKAENRPKYRSNSLNPDFFKTAVSLGEQDISKSNLLDSKYLL